MEVRKEQKQNAVRISAHNKAEELGAMYLYLIKNDSHKEPYGLLEDLLVKEPYRKQGVGSALVKEALTECTRLGCYKVIGTSRRARKEVHQFYEKLGLKKYGYEFRLDL